MPPLLYTGKQHKLHQDSEATHKKPHSEQNNSLQKLTIKTRGGQIYKVRKEAKLLLLFTMSLFIPSKTGALINLSIHLVGELFPFLTYFTKSNQYLTEKKKRHN